MSDATESGGRRFVDVGGFGPELLPATTVINSVRTLGVAFTTEAEAARGLLPYHFEPAAEPVVRVTHLTYGGIDYLAGRGYNVLSVSVSCVFAGAEPMQGAYSPVLWESLTHPVCLGRELQGYAKIGAEVPDTTRTANGFSFECREFGAPLLEAEVHDLQPLTGDRLARVQAAAAEGFSFGWKYIPGMPGEAPDCDYPTKIAGPVLYDRVWRGAGTVAFCDRTWDEAPISSRIVSRLRALPVRKWLPALVGEGSSRVPRSGVERLTR